MVQKMLAPNPMSANALAARTGVPQSTLSRWLREATTLEGMPTDRRKDKPTPTARPPHEWTAEEKLAVVLEAAAVPETELGVLLRRKGIHEAQLREWRQQAVAGLQGAGKRSKTAAADARRLRQLERELARKEKALAEAAALLVLKKKAQAIWGDEDDDTDPKSDE